MSDILHKREMHDPAHINLTDEQDVQYWTSALGIPEEELRRVVAEVGDNAEAVRMACAQRRPPSVLIER